MNKFKHYLWLLVLAIFVTGCFTFKRVTNEILNSDCATINVFRKANNNIIINDCDVYNITYDEHFFKKIYPLLIKIDRALQLLLEQSNLTYRQSKKIQNFLDDQLSRVKFNLEANWDVGKPNSKRRANEIKEIISKGLRIIRKTGKWRMDTPLPAYTEILGRDIIYLVASNLPGYNPLKRGIPDFTESEIIYLLNTSYLDLSNPHGRSKKFPLHNLEGIGLLPELTTLKAHDHLITTIKHLVHAPGIESLSLDNNHLNKLHGIEQLRVLKYLSLRNNDLTNLNGIENLIHLEEIHLEGNPLRSIDALITLCTKTKKLRKLSINCNELPSYQRQMLFQLLGTKLICK